MSPRPCRHCGDGDAADESGLCSSCERDRDLATPRPWVPLGSTMMLEEDACGRPLRVERRSVPLASSTHGAAASGVDRVDPDGARTGALR